MAARQEVTFIISARDRTRAVFRRIRGGLSRMRAGLLGIFGLAGFGGLVKDALNFASSIENAAGRVGIAGDELEALRIVAKNNGVEFNQLLAIVQRLSRAAGEAVTGVRPDLIEKFEKLGVAFDVLARGDPQEIFLAVAEGARQFEGTLGELQTAIQQLGDIEAVSAIKLFKEGRERIVSEIERLRREGKILGEERREDAAEAERVAREELGQLLTEMRGLVAELVPVLRELTPVLRDWAIVANRLVSSEEGLARAVGAEVFGEGVNPLDTKGNFASIGQAIFEAMAETRNISGTPEDPAVREAILRTARASEITASRIGNGESFR